MKAKMLDLLLGVGYAVTEWLLKFESVRKMVLDALRNQKTTDTLILDTCAFMSAQKFKDWAIEKDIAPGVIFTGFLRDDWYMKLNEKKSGAASEN